MRERPVQPGRLLATAEPRTARGLPRVRFLATLQTTLRWRCPPGFYPHLTGKLTYDRNGMISNATTLINLSIGLMAGPAVSL
jgi:hypothetical protein